MTLQITQASEKQEAANTSIVDLKAQMTSIKEGDKAQKAQISDLNSLINDMKEQKNKDIKQVNDEKKWAAFQKRMEAGVTKEQQFIFDSLAQIFTGNADSNYRAAFDEYFATAEAYGGIVRRAKPEKLGKDALRSIAHRVNQDADGNMGDVQNFIVEGENALTNIDFFVHFKILYKLTQMGLTAQRRDAYAEKMSGNDSRLHEIEEKVATQEQIADNLKFGEMLAEEATRMRTVEIAELSEKLNKLREEIEKLKGQDFEAVYFAELNE